MIFLFSVELTDDYRMHIVNKDGKAYVTGPELSHILFGKDILRSKVSVFHKLASGMKHQSF